MKIFIVIIYTLLVPVLAYAQDGSVPIETPVDVKPADAVQPIPRETPTPVPTILPSATPRPALPSVTQQPAPSVSPLVSSIPSPAFVPVLAPITEAEETAGNSIWYIIEAVVVAGLGGFVVLKSKEKSKKDKSRCPDIKKLLDDKIKELTDVRGHIEGKAKAAGEKILLDTIKGTAVADALIKVRELEAQVNRLKKLYEECILETGESKRVFIIHGWDGYPEEGWFPWVKKELEQKGFKVQIPAMPKSSEPEIKAWVDHISKLVGKADKNTFFVGHSIGCQAVMRYLEGLEDKEKVGGVVFVAGWFVLSDKETEEEKRIAKPWIETPIDIVKVKKHCGKFTAIFSDDDDVIPPENKKLFEERFGIQAVVEHEKGHFSGGDGVTELPSVLQWLLK